MILNFNTALRDARAQQIINAINAGVGPGTMQFYTATKPATPGAAITTQTLLGTLTFSEPAGTITAGQLNFATIIDDSSVDADGVCTWVRILDGGGNWVMDGDVTDNLGTGFVKMPSTQVYAGGILHITSAYLVEGNV